MSTEDCSSEANPECKSEQDNEQCSGFLHLELPGTGELPPYTIAVATLDGAPARFTLEVTQLSRVGLLYDPTTAASG